MKVKYSAAIEQARELTLQNDYTIDVWMKVLNREARNEPELLRRTAIILAGLKESPTPS